jgi:vancomycin resistance protein YoaR
MERDQLGIPVSLNSGEPKTLTVNDVNNFTYCEPENAYYQKQAGEITVAPEVYGRYLDIDEAEQLLSELHEGGDSVEIPYYISEPEITAKMLDEKLFDSVIASYSTSYGTSPVNRCANIANAASKINGKTLMPGDVFSFNEVVGPRSAANGFYSAKEYVNGETVDGIGGGTCQVSSTLYNAVLYSDLSIVTRTNHMFPVDYCPIGQDATVADSGIDFKFVNSMNYPIKISAVTEGYTITVSIIGTERDDPRTVDIENTVTQSGSDQSVHSVRYVYNSSGELIQSDDLGNSYYMAHNN